MVGGVGAAAVGALLTYSTVPFQPGPADEGDPPLLLWLVAAVLIVRGLAEALGWWFRTYDVGDTELVIDEGIFARNRKVVPYARLQQVDIAQGPIAQVMNLAQLRLSLAGGAGSTGASLQYLERPKAEALRAYMLHRRSELAPTTTVAPDAGAAGHPTAAGTPPDAAYAGWSTPPRHVLSLDPSRLLLAGATSLPVAVTALVAALAAASVVVAGAFGGASSLLTATALVVPIVATALLVAVMSVVNTVLGLYGWTLTAHGDDLHLRNGLLQVRQVTLPRRRVQRVAITDNPLRRAMGLVALTVDSAAPLTSVEVETNRVTVPILPRALVPAFLHELMATDRWALPELTPRPPAARRRAVLRRSAFLFVVAFALAPFYWPEALVPAVAVTAVGIPWGLVAHRRAGWGTTPTLVAFAAGVVHHTIDLVPIERVQSARTTASPLQRTAHLCTLHVDVAGATSSPNLYDMPADDARLLCRQLPREAGAAPSPV